MNPAAAEAVAVGTANLSAGERKILDRFHGRRSHHTGTPRRSRKGAAFGLFGMFAIF